VERGYIDDHGFAAARAGALARKGYGPRRVAAALRAAGVDPALGVVADDPDQDEARRIAHIYARKRRIGPYARAESNPDLIRKWTAAMINAGHSYSIASELARLPPVDN
jgi:regulatory protein